MPEKDGDDDKKSTKSVVNKKQKQMMGEEGYDIARDMGKVKPSKDKKDATTMPVSDEVKKTQKVNKGPSALERVKVKYGKSVMNVGKKKANEELDLTQVAEAFGGYIVEAPAKDEKKNKEEIVQQELELGNTKTTNTPRSTTRTLKGRPIGSKNKPKKTTKQGTLDDLDKKKFDPSAYINMVRAIGGGKKGAALDKEILARREAKKREKEFLQRQTQPQPDTKEIGDTQSRQTLSPEGQKRLEKISQSSKIGDTTVSDFKKKLEKLKDVEVEGDNERGARRRAKRDPEIAAMTPGQKERNIRQIKKDIDDRNPTIDTEVGKVPYRNRRVPKTRSLVPQYDRTPEIMKPDTDELLKFKDFRKKTKTTTAELDRDQEFRAPRIPKTQTETEPPKPPNPPIVGTAVGAGGDRPKKPDAFSSIKKFAKKNPQIAAAGALAGYDIGKGILSKIMKLRTPSVQGGRAIQVSAKQ